MGGLVSAVILAKEGYKVCVLEKNNQYGGCLQTFSREKSIFDTGVHYLGSLNKGENLHQYFQYLGIMDELKVVQMNKLAYDYITFDGDKNQYPHAQGYSNFTKQLLPFFPNEQRAIEIYCDKMQAVCKSFPLYNLEDGEDETYNQAYFSQSIKGFLDSITNNETLKSVLVGSNLLYAGNGDKTPIYIHALTVNSYIKSAWKCVRGGSQITKLLVKQLRKHGGDIFKRHEVQHFVFEDKTPIGVKVQNDEIFYAKKFIANTDLNATINIVGKEHFRNSFVKRISNLEVTTSSFSVHIKIKPNTFPYLNYNFYHFKEKQSVWNATQSKDSNWPKMYMLSMGINEKNQQYADNMSVLTYMDFSKVKAWENSINTIVNSNERGEEYEKFKQKHIDLVLDAVEKKFPDIRAHIQSVYASTPLSFRDYIGGKNGNLYGFEKGVKDPLKTFVYPKTKIENLYLTGQSVNTHGILGTTIGAVATCSEILGKTYLVNKIKAEVNAKTLC